jgi:hypothetical protein
VVAERRATGGQQEQRDNRHRRTEGRQKKILLNPHRYTYALSAPCIFRTFCNSRNPGRSSLCGYGEQDSRREGGRGKAGHVLVM